MARLGTKKHPAIVRVHSMERAEEILAVSNKQGWIVIAGVEPDQPEDVSDFERLLHPNEPVRTEAEISRNAACPCGSGKRYKRCCGRKVK